MHCTSWKSETMFWISWEKNQLQGYFYWRADSNNYTNLKTELKCIAKHIRKNNSRKVKKTFFLLHQLINYFSFCFYWTLPVYFYDLDTKLYTYINIFVIVNVRFPWHGKQLTLWLWWRDLFFQISISFGLMLRNLHVVCCYSYVLQLKTIMYTEIRICCLIMQSFHRKIANAMSDNYTTWNKNCIYTLIKCGIP